MLTFPPEVLFEMLVLDEYMNHKKIRNQKAKTSVVLIYLKHKITHIKALNEDKNVDSLISKTPLL